MQNSRAHLAWCTCGVWWDGYYRRLWKVYRGLRKVRSEVLRVQGGEGRPNGGSKIKNRPPPQTRRLHRHWMRCPLFSHCACTSNTYTDVHDSLTECTTPFTRSAVGENKEEKNERKKTTMPWIDTWIAQLARLTRPATAMKSCMHIQRMHIYANNIGPRAPAEVKWVIPRPGKYLES